jgi:hypothetical protein
VISVQGTFVVEKSVDAGTQELAPTPRLPVMHVVADLTRS